MTEKLEILLARTAQLHETVHEHVEGLKLAEMLKDLESTPNAPQPIVEQLKQYQDATWKALNSFAHGGFHPLSRTLAGYPSELPYDVVRNSNAAMAYIYMEVMKIVSLSSLSTAGEVPARRILAKRAPLAQAAVILQSDTHQITSSLSRETTPSLSADNISPLVVYTSSESLGTGVFFCWHNCGLRFSF